MQIKLVYPASLAFGVGSACASALTAASDVAMQLVGVPLPVVLAAIAGAMVARSYTPSTNYFSAISATLCWTVGGCALAPLLQAIAAKFGVNVPVNGLAALALIASGGMPLALPIVKQKAPEIIASWLDMLKGKGGEK